MPPPQPENRAEPERGRSRRDGASQQREMLALEGLMSRAEMALYVIVALLLVVAAAFTLVGTVVDLIEGRSSRDIVDAGVFLLDRVLLLFIFAELLYTVRVVNLSGRVLVEPFLFIGLIAVVRKLLVLAAESEHQGLDSTQFVTQLGALAALALVLSLAIFLLRRSAGGR
jgi:uncharacterized membrane protein (DUF373 family)